MHIGIDLGTTFCCVAFIQEGVPKIITDSKGNETTPSVVWFDGVTAYVGEKAINRKITDTSPVYEYFKRDIGKPVESKLHKVEIAPYEIKGVKYGSIGLSAILLRKLKKDTLQYFKKYKLIDESIKENEFNINAVITVPAYFGDEARQATKCAGQLAGLNVIGMINEPTAASITFGTSINENKTILVFDLGGGTFDVTILEIKNGDFIVKATDGNTKLGGKDWDDIIIDYIKHRFKKITGTEIPDDMVYDVQEKAINAKMELTVNDYSLIQISANGHDIELKLKRSSSQQTNFLNLDIDEENEEFYFEERSSDLLSACSARCMEVLTNSSLSWSDIDEIVLAGGSCKMPMIPKMLEKLSGKKIKTHREGFSYDTAIAIGAALYGESRGKVKDITSKHIGIKLTKNTKEYIDFLINKDEEIPIINRARKYPSEENAILEIYEGDSREPSECVFRGKLELENKQDHVTIIFNMDENGILSVLADYQPEGTKEAKIKGDDVCPDYLFEKIKSLNINS